MEILEQDYRAWRSVFCYYDRALLVKASRMNPGKKKELIELDNWYQTDMPVVISERKPKYVTQEELCKLMKWKLTRGKFRPRLTEMVKTNSEEEVKDASTKAFQSLPDVSAAIQALTVLKAVGPATASGVLAAGAPTHVAFMADESMQAFPELKPIKYDLPFYREYIKLVKKIVKRLNLEDSEMKWTPHKVELTLWTYQIAKTLDKDLHKKITEDIESSCSDGPPRKKLKA